MEDLSRGIPVYARVVRAYTGRDALAGSDARASPMPYADETPEGVNLVYCISAHHVAVKMGF